jgi:hypothetical protein
MEERLLFLKEKQQKNKIDYQVIISTQYYGILKVYAPVGALPQRGRGNEGHSYNSL